MKVALLPTGETEWAGLARALGRLFPTHEFVTLPLHEDRDRGEPQLLGGFTSAPLSNADIEAPPGNAIDLVQRAAFEAIPTRNSRSSHDLVMIIDDVELANRNQEQLIVNVMRAAALQFIRKEVRGSSQGTAERTLRERVSFHLVRPMIEAWFFADPGALANAGVPTGAVPRLLSDCDIEAFQTDDDAYARASHDDCVPPAATPHPTGSGRRPSRNSGQSG